MEKNTYNMKKEFLLEQEKLLKQVKKLEKYYNKQTIDYLVSLIMLEQTVFKNLEFGEIFGSLDLFYEIAKHNLCNRTMNTISSCKDLDQTNLSANFFGEHLNISYRHSKDESFNVFSANLGKTKALSNAQNKPSVTLYDFSSPVEVQIQKREEEISRLQNVKYGSDAQFSGYDLEDKPIFTPVYGGPNSRKYFLDKEKIDSLKQQIERLKSYGLKQEEISNLVTDILLEDWNLKLKEENLNREMVLSLSWIDVNKHRI